MDHSAPTAAAAIEKLMRYQSITGNVDGGLFYVRVNLIAHPMRRFGACYVKSHTGEAF